MLRMVAGNYSLDNPRILWASLFLFIMRDSKIICIAGRQKMSFAGIC